MDSTPAAPPGRFLLGTAGHIDHGKTTLLRALTGIDCDRLPEEKQRGLTIDIGFAKLDLPPYQLDVIDVPGHERFIKNMLAGAVGIDVALLTVAADDSVMPQTREHLAILNLLGVECGVVAITKADRVGADWLELVDEDVRQLVAGTFLEGAAIVRTALPGEGPAMGLDELRDALRRVCQSARAKADSGIFRMPIDRSFSVPGRGTVVTGTVWSGQLDVHESIEWLPEVRDVTVRDLQHHGSEVERVRYRQRAAINISSVHHRQVERGQELATAGYLRPSRRLTVELQVLVDSPRAIQHRSLSRVYLGTQEIMARIELLDGPRLEPGECGLAQLQCATAALSVAGQSLIVREQSPLTTIGGGRVLQPCAPAIRRRQRQRVERLQGLRSQDALQRSETAVFFYGVQPWNELNLCRDAALSRCNCRTVVRRLVDCGRLIELTAGDRLVGCIHIDVFTELQQRIVRSVGAYHREQPLAAGLPRAEVAQQSHWRHDSLVLEAILQQLIDSGGLRGDKHLVALPSFAPRLTDAQEGLRQKLLALVLESGMKPRTLAELARATQAEERDVRRMLQLCVTAGELVHLGTELHLHRQTDSLLRDALRQVWRDKEGFTVSQFCKQFDTTRKYAIPICEYLDRIGATRRAGNLRRVCS